MDRNAQSPLAPDPWPDYLFTALRLLSQISIFLMAAASAYVTWLALINWTFIAV